MYYISKHTVSSNITIGDREVCSSFFIICATNRCCFIGKHVVRDGFGSLMRGMFLWIVPTSTSSQLGNIFVVCTASYIFDRNGLTTVLIASGFAFKLAIYSLASYYKCDLGCGWGTWLGPQLELSGKANKKHGNRASKFDVSAG